MRIVGKMINTLGTGENRAARSRVLQKRIKASWTATGIVLLAVVLSPSIANASSILGGSDLLNIAGADLLEGWLGQGELVFTNIFDKVPGDGNNSSSFHAAVDGRGRTFSLIEIFDNLGNLQVIGGYNPQSWSTIEDFNFTPLDSERTAFIFNLTEPRILRQILGDGNFGYGKNQTYNGLFAGPTFGGGLDLFVDSSLSRGFTTVLTYGTSGVYGSNDSLSGINYFDSGYFSIGDIEVFTIALENTPAVVPIPAAAPMVLLGMGMVAAVRRRKTSLQA